MLWIEHFHDDWQRTFVAATSKIARGVETGIGMGIVEHRDQSVAGRLIVDLGEGEGRFGPQIVVVRFRRVDERGDQFGKLRRQRRIGEVRDEHREGLNAGAADVQELTLSDGRPVWQQVAEQVAEWGVDLVGDRGLSSVGAVVGATVPRAVAAARKLLPRSVLLLPGVGAQGAGPADVARAFTSGPASALVTASRSVIYAYRSGSEEWRTAAGTEAADRQAKDHGETFKERQDIRQGRAEGSCAQSEDCTPESQD